MPTKVAQHTLQLNMYESDTEVMITGVNEAEDFLKFLDQLAMSLPAFLTEFIQERVREEYRGSITRDFLGKFIVSYLELSGIEIPDFVHVALNEHRLKSDSTVH